MEFKVRSMANGFVIVNNDPPFEETYYKNEKKLVTGIRSKLGMPVQGRPKFEALQRNDAEEFPADLHPITEEDWRV